MAKRWSKLQHRLYNIMCEDIDFQLHCALYEMNSNNGYHITSLPRYFIAIDKNIVWDYPKMHDTTLKYGRNSYPWDTDISKISEVIEEYIQRPESELMQPFTNDRWSITNIIRVCDRRIGKRRLTKLRDDTEDEVIKHIISLRLNKDR